MIGKLSVVLAAYEVFAWLTDRRTVSHQQRWLRIGVFLWWGWLGYHLLSEAMADDVAAGMAASFSD